MSPVFCSAGVGGDRRGAGDYELTRNARHDRFGATLPHRPPETTGERNGSMQAPLKWKSKTSTFRRSRIGGFERSETSISRRHPIGKSRQSRTSNFARRRMDRFALTASKQGASGIARRMDSRRKRRQSECLGWPCWLDGGPARTLKTAPSRTIDSPGSLLITFILSFIASFLRFATLPRSPNPS